MTFNRFIDLLSFLALFTLIPESVWAWGPEIHYFLGSRLLELGLVGGTAGQLIGRHSKQFLYGNVIADIVVGKSFLEQEDHSHHWSIDERLQQAVGNDQEEAFAQGIRCHLAADTIAHNVFVPDWNGQFFPSTRTGHIYWEMRAGLHVPLPYKTDLRELMKNDFEQEQHLLESVHRDTILPFPMNWTITNRLVNLFSHRSWHKFSEKFLQLSRFNLGTEIDNYFNDSLKRMEMIMGTPEEQKSVRKHDPM